MNFETFLSFLIKPFSYMTKKSKQMLKYRNDEKSFWGKIKSILHHFKGLSVARSCCRSKSAPLKTNTLTNLFLRTPSSLSSRLYKMRSANAYHLKLGANILWPKFFFDHTQFNDGTIKIFANIIKSTSIVRILSLKQTKSTVLHESNSFAGNSYRFWILF